MDKICHNMLNAPANATDSPKSTAHSQGVLGRRKAHKICIVYLICVVFLFLGQGTLIAQQGGQMEVAETDEETGRAIRFNFNFTSQELKNLFEWLSRETDLTIIASESDIQGKRFSLINLNNVTLDEVIEKVKTVLAQYELTFVRVDSTLLVTTFEKAKVMNVPVKRIQVDPEQVEMTDEIQTYIIQLENADAAEQAETLKPLLNKQANIFADTTNALVITDVSSNVRRVVSILQFADEGERSPLKVAIVPLTHANAEAIRQTLTEVLEDNKENIKSAQTQIDVDPEKVKQAFEQGLGVTLMDGMIQVHADEHSNSLIIRATEGNLIILKEIIRLLDVTPTLQTEIKTYRLKYAPAADVASTIEQIITGQASQNTGRYERWTYEKMRAARRERGESANLYQGIVGVVNISSNDRLNILVVSSDPRNFNVIEKIINELDTEQTQEELRMYILEYAKATTLAANLQDLFEGGSAARDRNLPWWERRDRETTENPAFGVQGPVNIVTDTRLNALLISTASQNFTMIEDLINRIDVTMPDQEWRTRFFYLKHADSENVANLLNTIYKGDTSSGGGGSSYYSPFYYLRSRQSTPQAQGVLSGMVYAEPYPNLNAVLVSTGTKRNFDLIAELMKQIDIPTPEAQKEITEIIRLEYATADSLAQILAQVWQDAQAEDEDGFSFGRFFRSTFEESEPTDINSLFGKVTVFADPDTNSLIVTTRRRYLDQVRTLIKQLDFVRGQVRIDIKILEVTLDETTKLGLEVAAKEKRLGGIEITPGNPLIGEINAALGLQQEISGFNYGLATKEYMAFLHTLIRENKVRTISTPMLLTRDSKAATWSSGRRIPYLQSVDTNSILGDTATQPLFNYDFINPPIGINIELTPYIAKSKAGENGKRTIGLAIVNLSASNFIEFTDFNAPITDDNSLSVVIDVEDGQQIVVGGIIRKKQKQVENKIPILGDIPLLGKLFKRTETEVQDTEIVFIITPHIVDIQNPEDIKKLRQEEQNWRKNGINEKENDSK